MIEKLILGTVQLGLPYGINNTSGQPTADQAQSVLDTAYKHGIRSLDTAEAYGEAQKLIGDYHQKKKDHKFSVITKYSADASSEKTFIQKFLNNLETLHIASLQAYLFHSFDGYKSFPYWEVLEQFIEEGLVKQIGISVYTNEQVLKVLNDDRIGIVQLPYNLLDNFTLRGDLLRQLKNNGKEVHIRSVFLQGLFYKDRNNLQKLEPLKKSLEQLDRLSKISGVGIGALALAYCLRQPLIDKILVGVETELQLLENIRLVSQAVTVKDEILSEIDNVTVDAPQLLNPSYW